MTERTKPDNSEPVAATRNTGSATGDGRPLRRLQSRELFGREDQVIIEHSGREYRLRVTSNGKLILTA